MVIAKDRGGGGAGHRSAPAVVRRSTGDPWRARGPDAFETQIVTKNTR